MEDVNVVFLKSFERLLKRFKIDQHSVKDKITAEIQQYVDEHPESLYFPDSGAGIGNVWKIRVDGRGGYRAIYFAIPRSRTFYFILIYPKSKQSNLTAEQKKVIKTIIKSLES